jgi:malate synthase
MAMNRSTSSQDVEVLAPVTPEYSEILTPEALGFVAEFARQFETRRRELMARRAAQ